MEEGVENSEKVKIQKKLHVGIQCKRENISRRKIAYALAEFTFIRSYFPKKNLITPWYELTIFGGRINCFGLNIFLLESH